MLSTKDNLPIASLILTGWMPSFLKKAYYRLKGYRIGKNVSLGLGCVVIGDDVEIRDSAQLGMLSIFRGRRIEIGERVKVGFFAILDTFDIRVGEGTRIGNQVIVGGMQSPESRFHMGRNGILMEWSFVNTTMPVDIGDDVGIGGHCLFFTHGMWPNTFEGYPAGYAPIRIEDQAWLAWRITVLPGAVIGRGSIVSSDACVIKPIPPMAMAAGVPAKPLREDGAFLAPHDDTANLTRLTKLLTEFDAWLAHHGTKVETGEGLNRRFTDKSGSLHSLTVRTDASEVDGLGGDCVLSLSVLTDAERASLETRGIPWLDVACKERSRISNQLAEETEDFMRRGGLRFLKFSRWTG
jgi:acetyltransferase-like isoleucine patch superfamily enzyme